MNMETAVHEDRKEILELYKAVIDKVNMSPVRLGWNIEIYPNAGFIDEAVSSGEMFVLRRDGRIISAAVVNHNVNPEYDDIDWQIKGPPDRLATIHALAVLPEVQGMGLSRIFLSEIEDMCRRRGDLAIHLDVIDTNIPAYNLYTGHGYEEIDRIRMFYEVVGTRDFWMLEHVL